MKLHRFYVDESLEGTGDVSLSHPQFFSQVKNVLRLKEGDEFIAFNKGANFDYHLVIKNYTKDSIIAAVQSKEENNVNLKKEIYLFAAIVKKDKVEWVVEKSTELGVSDIFPVISERSEKKNLNENRIQKIAIEATEQSGRSKIPRIHPIMKLEESLEFIKEKEIEAIVFHTQGERLNRAVFSGASPIAIFIGPEGGWSPKELELFERNKIKARSLGPQILRAETAVVAALSQFAFD